MAALKVDSWRCGDALKMHGNTLPETYRTSPPEHRPIGNGTGAMLCLREGYLSKIPFRRSSGIDWYSIIPYIIQHNQGERITVHLFFPFNSCVFSCSRMAMSSISTAIFQGADEDVDVTTGIMVEPIAEPTVMMLTRKPRRHPRKWTDVPLRKGTISNVIFQPLFFRGDVSFQPRKKNNCLTQKCCEFWGTFKNMAAILSPKCVTFFCDVCLQEICQKGRSFTIHNKWFTLWSF